MPHKALNMFDFRHVTFKYIETLISKLSQKNETWTVIGCFAPQFLVLQDRLTPLKAFYVRCVLKAGIHSVFVMCIFILPFLFKWFSSNSDAVKCVKF